MSILKKIFSAGASTVIDSVGGAIDKLVTSDEERLALKNELVKMEAEAMASFDSEVTSRHAADMASDSWLSKNIRPLTLAFLILSTIVLAYLTIFQLEADQAALVDPWIGLLQTLDVTAITFYFGSRGLEKVKMKK